MAGVKFNESLVLDLENPDSTAQVEGVLANHLYELGSVKESYMGALAEREKNYPTALEPASSHAPTMPAPRTVARARPTGSCPACWASSGIP